MALKIGLLCIVLVILGRLSLFLSGTEEGVALVWLPAGAAFVSLVFIDRHLWPGVTLGAFITNVTFGLPIYPSIGIAFGSTLGVLAGVYALQLAAFRQQPGSKIHAVKFNAIGATVNAPIAAMVGVIALYLAGIVPLEALLGNGWRWWAGDALGICIVGAMMWPFLSFSTPGDIQNNA